MLKVKKGTTIMKKQYINPTTYIFEMQMENHVLAGSGITKNASGEVESVGIGGGDYSGSGMKSRQSGLWDDEEEE